MLHRRLQVLIDEGRYQRIQDYARGRGISVARVIRDLVDEGLPASEERRQAAATLILGAEPMDVPQDPHELRRELDEAHDRW